MDTGAPQALPPTSPAAEPGGSWSRAHSQAYPQGTWGWSCGATARSPAAIPLSPLASTPPNEDLDGSPAETHGAPCTPQLPWGLCPIGEASSQLSILARAYALIHQEGLLLVALNPPLRSSDSSQAAPAALHTCLQGH